MKFIYRLNKIVLMLVLAILLILFFPERNKIENYIAKSPLWPMADDEPLTEDNLVQIGQVPILMFHYIRDPNYLPAENSVGRSLSVSPRVLENQLKTLAAQDVRMINLSALIDKNISGPSVILTFDDGYHDFYQNAWPILKKFNAQATVFIITEKIGRPGYLSAAKIQEISAAGIEIGSHTVSHPNLTNVSLGNINLQLEKSKSVLEEIIGKPVVSFCYPSGKYNEQVVKDVLHNNYQIAVTTDYNIADLETNQLLELPRIRVKNNTDILEVFKQFNFAL